MGTKGSHGGILSRKLENLRDANIWKYISWHWLYSINSIKFKTPLLCPTGGKANQAGSWSQDTVRYILRCFYFLASRLRRSAQISPFLEKAWESFSSYFFVTNGGSQLTSRTQLEKVLIFSHWRGSQLTLMTQLEKVLVFCHNFLSLTGFPTDLLDVYIVNLLFCRDETTNNI